jgi:hypothetical protein
MFKSVIKRISTAERFAQVFAQDPQRQFEEWLLEQAISSSAELARTWAFDDSTGHSKTVSNVYTKALLWWARKNNF